MLQWTMKSLKRCATSAKAQLGGAMRNSLTVARANRFVAQLPGGKGARYASRDLPIRQRG